MTKIVTKLPVTAETLQRFREDELRRMIAAATNELEENFAVLCDEFTTRFNADEWIFMANKDVCYINDIVALMPNLSNFDSAGNMEYDSYNVSRDRRNFFGFNGDLMTESEARKCFNDRLKYFRYSDGRIDHSSGNWYRGLSIKRGNAYGYMYTYNNCKYYVNNHGNRYYTDTMLSIPIFRFNGEDSAPATSAAAIFYWLKYDLTPKTFKSTATKNLFSVLKNFFAKYKEFMTANAKISLDTEKIFMAALSGKEFGFLPDAKKLLTAKEIPATETFRAKLENDLLTCDRTRADLDPYDKNLLLDPNRGHWDLWDYGDGEEKAGEITLSEGMTARDPADDINHGIVAIDFGTKSTVVVYENDRLQILPLQVGNGRYGNGVELKSYENPTVIQFINAEKFIKAYNARAGRPFTEWNDVTVSHDAFENLANSNSEYYYSFLTGLKHWCGSNNRLKLKDGKGVTKDLPPFMDLMADDVNPLEFYAYYLGLYINNMLQEKRIFLKYIMSFPVTYDNAIRERMRRAFERGLKKSLPTALLSNETAMKNFVVQDGASEPAAYAITALQEYGFDPTGDDENYYAVFDFGGGTTDFDFGVLRESTNDRYDYSLIHFGENGDKTLGGENLLKLLAFEVFKANQPALLKPKDDNSIGKIQFTLDADKQDFVGSAALIKDSQEANLNMHNLEEVLRDVWENPDGDATKKIFDSGTIEVDLFTDKGLRQPKMPLYIAFEDGTNVDLKKILRDRIEQGVRNFFIAMKEAFDENSRDKDLKIKPLKSIDEISIFLAGNSSKAKLVTEIFAEYLGEPIVDDDASQDDGKFIPVQTTSKAQEIFGLTAEQMPKFKIFPALGTAAAHELQKTRGIVVNPNDLASPTGKTGVAFGLLKCRDSGNVQITHITPDKNYTPFQFYVGRNKKRKFKTVIDKNTKLGTWFPFIDAGNSFDILYSDLPEAVSNNMDVSKARRVNVTLTDCDPKLTVFVRAVKANVIEYQITADIDDFEHPEKLNGVEPMQIVLT